MADLVAVLSTAFIPLTSFTSLAIYLSTHPSSRLCHIFAQQRIALPSHRDEGLDGALDHAEKDPFDVVDPVVCDDGTPIEPENFWSSMWKRKIAFLLSLIPPLVCNILLLVFTALRHLPGEEQTRSILLPILLIPSQSVVIIMGLVYLGENDTRSHWPTTIHLSVNLVVQFLVLAIFALLPSSPLPSNPPVVPSLLLANFARVDLFKLPSMTPLNVLKPLLPILHIPPLLIVLFIRRGPPLHLDLDAIYPAKITNAVPSGHEALDRSKTNVTQEVQATVPEWLLFSYATDVLRKGYVAESMDVWDLPILQASMREYEFIEPIGSLVDDYSQAPYLVTKRCGEYTDDRKGDSVSGRVSIYCGSWQEPILGPSRFVRKRSICA